MAVPESDGTGNTKMSSNRPLSTTLRLPNIPVTHVENMCASGTEAFRGACYAVASGAADFALALGVAELGLRTTLLRTLP